MERFLEEMFVCVELLDYKMIGLTGLSCMSTIFLEVLRQYVPGKLIRTATSDDDRAHLITCCLEGALTYFFTRRLGYSMMAQETPLIALPVEIVVCTLDNCLNILVDSLYRDDHIGCDSRNVMTEGSDPHLSEDHVMRNVTSHITYHIAELKNWHRRQ